MYFIIIKLLYIVNFDELLELRAILDEEKIPYTEVPSREEAGPEIREEFMQDLDPLVKMVIDRE